MRDRISDPTVLQDSLKVAEKKFRINRQAELDFLKKHPDQWVEVLKALRNEPSE
jgi:hypothetical protein